MGESPTRGLFVVGTNSPPVAPSTPPAGHLASLYAHALRPNLTVQRESALRKAYEIGRKGIAQGVGLLEMATMHHEVLAETLLRISKSPRIAREVQRAGEFFAETLSPYEMARRGFRDAVSALRQLNETMECEIQRIARSVHDQAGQLLDAARLAMSGLSGEIDPSLRERLREIGWILNQAEEQLRRLSHELRPTILDDLGLVPALQLLAESVSRRTGVLVQVENCLDRRLAGKIETALYRIVQEALTNVHRHAQARNVRIRLTRGAKRSVRCVVRDDGKGFDVASVCSRPEHSGLGLIGIRERLNAVGGTLQIQSAPGRGTELRVEIPVEK